MQMVADLNETWHACRSSNASEIVDCMNFMFPVLFVVEILTNKFIKRLLANPVYENIFISVSNGCEK
jgi:hypothetical protein